MSNGGVKTEIFDVREWLAALCSHAPNKGESRRWRAFVTSGITVTFPGAGGKIE
jgi:hypothetical protein